MNSKFFLYQLVVLGMIGVAACSPVATEAVTPTAAARPTETVSPTETVTPGPSPVPTIEPGVILGRIVLGEGEPHLYTTPVELRLSGSDDALATVLTDQYGAFSFSEIPSAGYEIWAILSDDPVYMSDCEDVTVGEGGGSMLIVRENGQTISAYRIGLQQMMEMYDELKDEDPVALGVFVTKDFVMYPDRGREVVIHLVCE